MLLFFKTVTGKTITIDANALKDRGNIVKAFCGRKGSLAAGTTNTLQNIGSNGGPQFTRELPGDDGGLIVATAPPSKPVKRHRDNHIHIGPVRLGGHQPSQPRRKKPSRREVAMILQLLRDNFIGVLVMIIQKGGGVSILQRFTLPAQ